MSPLFLLLLFFSAVLLASVVNFTPKDIPEMLGLRYIKDISELDSLGLSRDKVLTDEQLPQPYRVISPGDLVTAEYFVDRMNVYVNEDGIVVKVEMG